jgi:predicted DNA-binding transcriptional regulator AlpA
MSQPIPTSNPWRQRSPQAAANLAEALERVMAEHAAHYANVRPELMRDRDIRREYFGGIGRSTYWTLTKRAGFPRAIEVSPKIKLRKRSEIERWLAEQREVA